jgi:hypothetical protein
MCRFISDKVHCRVKKVIRGNYNDKITNQEVNKRASKYMEYKLRS